MAKDQLQTDGIGKLDDANTQWQGNCKKCERFLIDSPIIHTLPIIRKLLAIVGEWSKFLPGTTHPHKILRGCVIL